MAAHARHRAHRFIPDRGTGCHAERIRRCATPGSLSPPRHECSRQAPARDGSTSRLPGEEAEGPPLSIPSSAIQATNDDPVRAKAAAIRYMEGVLRWLKAMAEVCPSPLMMGRHGLAIHAGLGAKGYGSDEGSARFSG